MDNKLSELSKPVAWVLGTPSCKHLTADAEYADWYLEHGSTAAPLYSQEYVSALISEHDAYQKALKSVTELWNEQRQRIAELEAIRADASQVLKEIGNELGCNPDNESIMMAIDELKAQVKVWESAATKHLARAEEAEQRIAELSDLEAHNECLLKKNSDLTQQNIKLGERLATPVQLQNCDFESVAIMAHWCTDEQLEAWVKGVEHAKKQIRAAGFKVAGDEQ